MNKFTSYKVKKGRKERERGETSAIRCGVVVAEDIEFGQLTDSNLHTTNTTNTR
jgi:hypothetical protein